MSLMRKVSLLTFLLIIFIIYSVSSFDYTKVGVEQDTYVLKKEIEIKPINIEFEIIKSNNLAVVSGLFKDEAQVEILTNYLNINKTDYKRYDKAIVYSQKNIDEIKNLISPLKDYFEDNSKIILKDKIVTIEGKLKEKKLKPLLEAIINKSSVQIDLKLEEIEEIVEAEEEIEEVFSLQEEINAKLKENKIIFKRNSTTVAQESIETIKTISELIKESPKEILIEIAGHTDAKGKKALNRWISKERALSVMNELINSGIDAKIVEAKGYGEEFPIEENELSELNRRVEIIIFDLEKIEEDKIALQDKIDSLIKEQKINFERRSTNVTDDSLIVIEKIAELVNNSEHLTIEVGGHTDAKGKKSLNKWISEKRAKSVRSELIKLGVDKKRLTAIGYGEEQPIAQNDENGLSEINRRVEFIVRGVK